MQITVPRGRTYCGEMSDMLMAFFKCRETYLSGLLEGLLIHSDKNDGVWAKAILSSSLHILDNVLAGCEVDECLRAELLAHLLLLLTSVNGNCSQTHRLRILQSKGAETATSTNDSDCLTWANTRLLQALVDGDTCAENRGDCSKIHVLREAGDVCSLGDGILLEGAVYGVAGEESV